MQYVVLHHTGIAEPHYDLMLERDAAGELLTWRIAQWPPTAADVFIPLAPHRRAYLTYEGKISGDRGQVTRREKGEYQTLGETSFELKIRLENGCELTLPKRQSI